MKVIEIRNGIQAPFEFWNLTIKEKLEVSNGWGPKKYGYLVPDTVYGLSITLAWDIHDFMYSGRVQCIKKEADNIFMDNMTILIRSGSLWLLPLREHRILMYYLAVKNLGNNCFTLYFPLNWILYISITVT